MRERQKGRSRGSNANGPRSGDRWAVILAGGDGIRLRPLTRLLAGDERPKQFCSLDAGMTLLDETRWRVAYSVDASRTLYALTKTHERFYTPIVGDVPQHQRVEQPTNAGTSAAILSSLFRLKGLDATGSVAFVPSDHFISDTAAFMSHVERAFAIADRRPELVLLIGVSPESPETDYGWIEPAEQVTVGPSEEYRSIARFWEKPDAELASRLMARGSVWNSFVMVGRIDAFLQTIRKAVQDLYTRFERVAPALGGDMDDSVVEVLYAGLGETNFSREVLTKRPQDFALLVADGVAWSDLGRPNRALARMREAALDRSYLDHDLSVPATGRAASTQ